MILFIAGLVVVLGAGGANNLPLAIIGAGMMIVGYLRMN